MNQLSSVEAAAGTGLILEGATDTAHYCSELVRKADKDRYLANLFAPDEKRAPLMALYAFSLEIARVRELTSEPATGEFRLQWWRDTIENIYDGKVPDHPVAQELAGAIEAGDLSIKGFFNLIDARAFDLYDDPMPSVAALEGYLGETSSALIQMAALILAGPSASDASRAAGHAGVAYGMTGLMRALPIHRSRGQCFLPAELLARSDLTAADIMAGKRAAAIRIALREMRQVALQHLIDAREHSGAIPAPALPAFLPVSLVDLYLKRLKKTGEDAIVKVVEVQQFRRQWRMLKAAIVHDF
jgi:phytoene synthase